MSNKKKEVKTQTSAVAVAIILIAVVIGVGAIVASLFIVKEKKALDEASKKQTVSEEKPEVGQIETSGGPVNESIDEGQGNGLFDGNEDVKNEVEATEDDAVVENTDENQDDDSETADAENPLENQPEDIIEEAVGEAETEVETEAEEEGSEQENQAGISVPSVVRLRPLLDSCYMNNGRFDKDALAAGGLNEGKVYDETDNCATFKQLVYAGAKGTGITDDCLARFAQENNISFVKTAVEYFGLDFSNAIVKENGDKVLFVITDMGAAEATLSDGGQTLCILLTEGIKSDDSSAEAVRLTIEVKSTATSKGTNTYMRVGLWY